MNDVVLRKKINALSKQNGISSHLLLQNYFLERFLYRISISEYAEKIILKGGLLISSLIGVDQRTTMDIDTAIKNMKVEEVEITTMVTSIMSIDTNDIIAFEFVDIKEIREMDEYFGYRVRLIANLGKIKQSISIDISTGDIITPEHIEYKYDELLGDGTIDIMTYNIESILAEKIETIISRGALNTRMRDFYDVYMLWKLKRPDVDTKILLNAVINTFSNRDSADLLEVENDIVNQIKNSNEMSVLWGVYSSKNSYIGKLQFEDVVGSIEDLLKVVKKLAEME